MDLPPQQCLFPSTGDTDPQIVSGANFTDNRGIIGLQAGCNRAISDSWVVGIEGSWISNPMNNQNNNRGFVPFDDPTFHYKEMITTNIQSVLSLTPRLGIAVSPDWLLYAKGGYAVARIDTSGPIYAVTIRRAVFEFRAPVVWHSGWSAGAGVEYRLFRNVTVGAEYDYYSFADVMHSGSTAIQNTGGGPAAPIDHRVDATVQTVMARASISRSTTARRPATPVPTPLTPPM